MKKKFFHTKTRSGIQKLLLSLLVSCFFTDSFAQNKISDLIKGNGGVSNHFTSLQPDQQVRYDASGINDVLGLDRSSKLVLIKSEPDQLGEIHYRYYQTYLGYEVENSMFIVHTKNRIITGLTGSIVTAFDAKMSAPVSPAYNAQQAIQLAITSVHAEKYMWQDPVQEQALKKWLGKQDATYYPTASLVWYSPGGEIRPGTLRLAYKVDVYAKRPLSRAYIYLDAQTQARLGSVSILCTGDATGTANTTYSGTRIIHSYVDTGTHYLLWDVTRGLGIITVSGDSATYGRVYTSNSKNWTLTGNDQGALDAHYGVESTYDFYFSNFNRNSVDDSGYNLISIVNEYNSYAKDNAYWDGQYMHYGRRLSNNASVTSIDVTGHELTHGVTQYTSQLAYQNEPGAINESMSDIMGKSVQFWSKPEDSNWQIGNDMGWIIRDMSNPNAVFQPDTYKGSFWYTGSDQNFLVHTNSGVGNYMFYLLVHGGSGTNDSGKVFSVTGIGLAKADQIIYRSETVYLTSTSNYADWRVACVKAAGDLYGTCSNEAWQTANAWYAVAVGPTPVPLDGGVCGAWPSGGKYDYAAASTVISPPAGCAGGTTTVTGATATSFTANTITFLPGFTAVQGCNFLAYVTPCTSGISLPQKIKRPEQGIAFSNAVDSKTMQEQKNGNNEFAAMVYPNPAKTTATLQVKGVKGMLSLVLTDVQGHVLWQSTGIKNNNISIPLNTLASGIYFINIKDDEHKKVLTLLKN